MNIAWPMKVGNSQLVLFPLSTPADVSSNGEAEPEAILSCTSTPIKLTAEALSPACAPKVDDLNRI